MSEALQRKQGRSASPRPRPTPLHAPPRDAGTDAAAAVDDDDDDAVLLPALAIGVTVAAIAVFALSRLGCRRAGAERR